MSMTTEQLIIGTVAIAAVWLLTKNWVYTGLVVLVWFIWYLQPDNEV